MAKDLLAFLSSAEMRSCLGLQQIQVGARECCGIIRSEGAGYRYLPLENHADRWHELDPEAFPRDSQTSYLLDRKQLEALVSKALPLVAIVHTHIDCPPTFSQEDLRGAFSEDGQHLLFPGVAYAIFEVRDLHLQSCALYAYAPEYAGFECLGHVYFT